MWIDYKKYKHWELIDQIFPIVRAELQKFLIDHTPYDMSDYKWFEEQYGEELNPIIRYWYAIPTVRAGKKTPWGKLMPKLEEISLALPGITNFTINAIAPGGTVPPHSDYDYDMRHDLSGIKKSYAILLCIDIPSDDIEKCGFNLGDDRVLLKTNDIVAFDGSVEHWGWNYTDKWRYTVNMDISGEFWNVA